MGIDYFVCNKCGQAFPDCAGYLDCDEDHIFCNNCIDKYGYEEDDETGEIIDCPLCKIKCKECGKSKPIGDKTGECLECLDWKMSDLRK